MSLYDVLNKGRSGSMWLGLAAEESARSRQGLDSSFGGSGRTSSGRAPIPRKSIPKADTSRDRTVPERIDANMIAQDLFDMRDTRYSQPNAAAIPSWRDLPEGFDPNAPLDPDAPEGPGEPGTALQIAETAGRAPGFAMERLPALAGSIHHAVFDPNSTTRGDDVGPKKDAGILTAAGDAVQWIQSVGGAIANKSTIETLARGTREGWDDDGVLGNTTLKDLAENPVIGGIIKVGLFPLAMAAETINANTGKGDTQTWREYKADAAKRGFLSSDIADYMSGAKASTDFGDKMMSSDGLTELALRFGSDPSNLVFLGGAFLKVGAGIGLAARAMKAGAISGKVLRPIEAGEMIANGVTREATMKGIGEYLLKTGIKKESAWASVARGAERLGEHLPAKAAIGAGNVLSGAARGVGYYKKATYAVTGAEVGIDLMRHVGIGRDSVMPEDGNGPLGWLYSANTALMDNKPFSENVAFSLWAAFNINVVHGAGTVLGAAKKGRGALLGGDVYSSVLKELGKGEGWGLGGKQATAAQVLARLGGKAGLNDMIVQLHAHDVFERLMKNPAMKAEMQGFASVEEAIAANGVLGKMVMKQVEADFKAGKVTGKTTVARMKRWFAQRPDIDSADFPWDGTHAIDRWTDYTGAASPLGKIFEERGVTIGLMDGPMAIDLRHMDLALDLLATEKGVPVGEVRSWLSRFPVLTKDPFFEKILVQADGTFVDPKILSRHIRAIEKNAPSVAEATHEFAARERGAAGEAGRTAEEMNQQLERGTTQIVASRTTARLQKNLGVVDASVNESRMSRADAIIARFEENIGSSLRAHGFSIDAVAQTIGSWAGRTEAAVQILMPDSTLPAIRLAAAKIGVAASQDTVVIGITHGRLRELNLRANGVEHAIQLPERPSLVQMDAIQGILDKEFPAWTLNDSTGRVSILIEKGTEGIDAAKIGRVNEALNQLYPVDQMGQSVLQTSTHPAYIEILGKKKGYGRQTYGEAIKQARDAGDLRARDKLRGLTDESAVAGDAAAGVGPDPTVGRVAGSERVSAGNGTKSPWDAHGIGDPATATKDGNFWYHATPVENLKSIADTGLEARAPGSGAWIDKSTAKRVYYSLDPQAANSHVARLGRDVAILRVKPDHAGNVRAGALDSESYSGKRVQSAQLEVWGGDGKWYALDSFHEGLDPVLARDAAIYSEGLPHAAAQAGNSLLNDSLDNYPGVGKWWGTADEANVYSGGEGAIRLRGKLSSAAEAKGSSGVVADGGALITGMEEMRGGKWVDLPMEPQIVPIHSETNVSGMAPTDFSGPEMYRVIEGVPDLARTPLGPQATVARSTLAVGTTVIYRGKTWRIVSGAGDQWQLTTAKGGELGQLSSMPKKGRSVQVVPEPRNPAGPFDPTPDTRTAGLRAGNAPTAGIIDTAALRAELVKLSPDDPRYGEVVTALEKADLAKGEAHRGEIMYMAKLDAAASAEYPFHRTLSDMPAEQLADLVPFEAFLREHYPAYTLQKAPNASIMVTHGGDIAARYLRDRTWVGNILADKMKGAILVDKIFSPVKNAPMRAAAKQALMNELIPHGATPKQVNAFLDALRDKAAEQTLGGMQLFRGGQALLPDVINKTATGNPARGMKGIFTAKTIASVGPGNFVHLLDKSSNRFIQMAERSARAGGKSGYLGRLTTNLYDGFATTRVGSLSRIGGKTIYPIFRFIADPRWWAMNIMEQDILNGLRYGWKSTRFAGKGMHEVGPASVAHGGSPGAIESSLGGEGTGYLYTRRQAAFVSKAFDSARPETVYTVLKNMESGEAHQALVRLVEKDRIAHGEPVGPIYREDLAAAVDDLLYKLDTKGPKKAVTEAAVEHLGAAETERLMPFLQQVWEQNGHLYDNISQLLGGNPNRTNLERVMNSYWLYWPLSYQVKTTRWLVDMMANKFGGAKTNLAPAAMYAHYADEHRKHMMRDPEYAQIFSENEAAWQAAQMMFPLTPGDVGISLNRGPRYVGGALGVWGSYRAAENPASAAGAFLEMGPGYTVNVLQDLSRETFDGPHHAVEVGEFIPINP